MAELGAESRCGVVLTSGSRRQHRVSRRQRRTHLWAWENAVAGVADMVGGVV